jgi:predicted RNase H-like HicB family nuclease
VKYAVVFEQSARNWAAYVPDLPGCVATGRTRDEAHRRIRSAIALHVQALRDQGEPVPEPTSGVEVVEV